MKRVGSKVYVHRSALGQLPTRDRFRVETLSRRLPDFDWALARVDKDTVMLGRTTSWDSADHPELLESIVVTGSPSFGDLRVRTYTGSRPIYHRCETMLHPDHPRVPYFTRLSAREERAGLLGRPDIGAAAAWARAKRRT